MAEEGGSRVSHAFLSKLKGKNSLQPNLPALNNFGVTAEYRATRS